MASLAAPPVMNRRVSISSSEYMATGGRRRSTIQGMGGLRRGRMGNHPSEDVTGKDGNYARLENTYKMTPDEGTRFSISKVEEVAQKVLDSFLKDRPYQGEQIGFVTSQLADMIRREIKDIGFRRYKFVVNVFLAQRLGQSVNMASQAVWDNKTDDWISVTHLAANYVAIAVIHGCYYE